MPLKLHGYPVSNYFNIARAALIEKRSSFQVVVTRAQASPEFLQASPMGKIPFLETPRGFIAETVAILEFLEDALPQPALYPADPLLRARGRQIINVIQMYVEAQVRQLYPGVFSDHPNDPTTLAAARTVLDRATRALSLLIRPDPYLLGDQLSHTDLFAFYCLDLADRVTRFVYARSMLKEIGSLDAWCRAMARRPSTLEVYADFYPAFAAYLAEHRAAYDYRQDIAEVVVPPSSVHIQ
jgi:glutathione S-transferase